MFSRRLRTAAAVTLLAGLPIVAGHTGGCIFAAQVGVITLDPNTKHQIMQGWEGTAQAGTHDSPYQIANHTKWLDTVLDGNVNDLGVNRLRWQVSCGWENTQDVFSDYIAGTATRAEWKATWNAVVNDNGDPQNLNASDSD